MSAGTIDGVMLCIVRGDGGVDRAARRFIVGLELVEQMGERALHSLEAGNAAPCLRKPRARDPRRLGNQSAAFVVTHRLDPGAGRLGETGNGVAGNCHAAHLTPH